MYISASLLAFSLISENIWNLEELDEEEEPRAVGKGGDEDEGEDEEEEEDEEGRVSRWISYSFIYFLFCFFSGQFGSALITVRMICTFPSSPVLGSIFCSLQSVILFTLICFFAFEQCQHWVCFGVNIRLYDPIWKNYGIECLIHHKNSNRAVIWCFVGLMLMRLKLLWHWLCKRYFIANLIWSFPVSTFFELSVARLKK